MSNSKANKSEGQANLKQHVLNVDEGGDLVGLVDHDGVLVLAAPVHAAGGPGQGRRMVTGAANTGYSRAELPGVQGGLGSLHLQRVHGPSVL